MILQKANLLEIVNGTTQCPAPTTTNAADIATWQSLDLSARLELITHMEYPQIQLVRPLTTAHEYWERLKASYEHKDVATQISLLKRLMSTTMSEDQDLPKYVESWRLLMDETTLSGVDLTPHLQAMILLASLPPSWQPFITTKTTVNMSVPLLIPAILQEHTLRTTISSSSHSSPMAMYVRNNHSRQHSNRRSNFNRPSSSSRHRPQHSRFSHTKRGFNLTKPYCKICAQPGHHTNDCCWHNNSSTALKTMHSIDNY